MGTPVTKYRRALDAARRELESLEAARDEIDARISQLRQTIGALSALCDEKPATRGFTDAIRDVLRASVEALTPAQVRDRLEASGFALDGYSNPLASIHVILKRLVSAGEAKSYEGPPGTTQYWWNRPMRAIAVTRGQLSEMLARFGNADTHDLAKKETR